MSTEIARKITVATVAGKAAKWFEKMMASKNEDGSAKPLKLLTVYGYANGVIVDAGDYGEYIKMVGDFRAISAETGEITNSPVLILPLYIGQMFRAALEVPERTAPVKFGFDVCVQFDVAASTKYVYKIINLIEPEQDDPLSKLGAVLGTETPLLTSTAPAPAPAPTADSPAPAPAPTPVADSPAPAPAPAKTGKNR